MSESDAMKRTHILSLFAVLSIGIYLFPILTITSLYTSAYFPYLLFGLYVITSLLGLWIRLRFTSIIEKNALVRGLMASATGILFAWVSGMLAPLSLPEMITLGAVVCIAAYTSLDFDPAFHSNRLWRLQLVGVISAIVSTIAATQIEFMLPVMMYTGYIYATGVVSFGCWVVGQYRAQLDRAVLNDGKRRLVLREFTRANHLRIIWMLIIIAGIGAFPSLAAWLAPLKDRLLAWIRGLFGTPSPQKPPLTPEMPNEPMNLPDELRGPPSEPSVIWEILGWIVFGVAAAVILWLLVKLGRTIMGKLAERFNGLLQPVQKRQVPKTEYVDISETLEVPTKVRKRWFRKKEPVPTQAGERIRYYYRVWVSNAMDRGVQVEKSYTPLETAESIKETYPKSKEGTEAELATRLPEVYNAVRYGKKDDETPDMIDIDRIWKSYSK
ncbi:hypothetical protein M3629_01510 [Paenibacillus polysaccharolyticus]|uniref:hypothetical protein n=1 Tax=Paenibacillus polysaccharolyticus TaxID=582692 RepID=UPI00203E4FA6|nr:hypothetical protein [Paenibacillus polysaccharolyticus]MCM3131443.1 hypothetical protein [Paenibacillus polysaccharolyticus]